MDAKIAQGTLNWLDKKKAEVIEHLRAFGSGRHLKKEGILLLGV